MSNDKEYEFYYKLIKEVKNNKCLFNKCDAFYYSRTKKEKAWKSVAMACGRSTEDCRARWKLLRERYCKELKKFELTPGNTGTEHSIWQFYNDMLFLRDSIVPRSTSFNSELKNLTTFNDLFLKEEVTQHPATPRSSTRFLSDDESVHSSEKMPPTKGVKTVNDDTTTSTTTIGKGNDDNIDELFIKHILVLMKDLPVAIKDKFQATMYSEIYKLRAEARSNNNM